MHIPFLSALMRSPLEGIQEHAEKVKECVWAFQQAIECHVTEKCLSFEEHRQEVIKLENEADIIKRRIRSRIPRQLLMPFNKSQIFMYLGEQDNVLNAVEDALDWLSHRGSVKIPGPLVKEIYLLVDAVIEPIEELCNMVAEARKYFRNLSEKQRLAVITCIRELREKEHAADRAEKLLKQKIFGIELDPVTVFHLIRFAEIVGSIADHAENAGDIMRAMLAR